MTTYNTSPAISQTAQAIQNFSLKQKIKSTEQSIQQFKTQVYHSDTWKMIQQSISGLKREAYLPFKTAWKRIYEELPTETTKLKFAFLQDYSYQERLLGLNVFAIGSALFTIRGYTWNTAYMKTFKAVRNSSLTYMIAGLILAPEIYNPIMKAY